MSMISAQIDELRKWADLYDGTTKPEMAKELQRPYLAQELRDAADTICEIRGALQVASVDYRHLADENAKLRELCATVIDDWMSKVCPSFPFCECGGEYQDCTDETCGNQIYRQMARELGVEVDG